jgi:FAD/FMN-containing dehydrogenase
MSETGALAEIVGGENVLSGPEVLDAYSSDESFTRPIRPRCVIKPGTGAEVERIVSWANQTGTPLVPVSSGPPHFHGDTVPSGEGAVIVDLSGMKRIIRVDRRNRAAMIEPGVTFGELITELEAEGLAPLMPLLPRGSKSVVTSFLERTPITAPRFHWEPQDPLLCVEVVYGSGDLLRTGSAAGPGSIEEQWAAGRAQIRGMGPSQIDFTRLLQGAQGTMGIVTWATVRCRPLPRVEKTFLVSCDDVGPLIELAYGITYKKLGEELLILNDVNLASILGKDGEEADRLRAELPPWVLVLRIDGAGLLPEEKVAYQEAESIELAQSWGLELKTAVAGASAKRLSQVLPLPSAEPYWKLGYRGACSDIFFVTTLDRAPGFIETVSGLAGDRRYPVEDIGIYIQPTVQGTNCHLEFGLNHRPQVRGEADRAEQFLAEGSQVLANTGAFFSRPYGPWARMACSRDAQTIIGQRRLKEIFDPNGIMNPGKLLY